MTSVPTRQKRDHTELDRLLHEIEAASGADRQNALNRLCRLARGEDPSTEASR
ncbi:hypothetical protein [Mycobacterium sp. PSTR-4-N]|uniref:hypothetical protein n=1 Tax=Mycobacterium sp. PSTR-4-N TaxID=2917745 RepID=UPI001F154512|nr:hypothetical protein [Mycobacterium sp. PSTR-4-N]MCG7594397.1 hypothetical protein [Mycobacterium sp. PSTR-4-N]